MLISTIVKIQWNKCNKKHYQQLGYIFTNYGDEFDVCIDDLQKNASVKVKAICDFCKKEYEVKWSHYREVEDKCQKHACYNCRHVKRYENDLRERQSKLYLNAIIACEESGYILLSDKSDILRNTSYIRYLCPLHGEHEMRVSNLISGKKCPDCLSTMNSERFRLSPDVVEKRICECGGRLLNKCDYKNQTEKNLLIECFECGKPFLTSLRNFVQHGGQVCSNCKNLISIGEYKIKQYLESHSINFIHQKWFADCRDKNPLPFDFYIADDNIIIEFDGRQHFEETEYFTYPLKMVMRHDQIKNDYCYNNNINLIRIPYWDINKIEKILDQKLFLHEDIV